MLAAALVTLVAPVLWHRREAAGSRRAAAYAPSAPSSSTRSRGSRPSRRSGRAGLARSGSHEERARSSRSTMWVLGTNTLARGITDVGIAVGAAVGAGLGAYRVGTAQMELPALLVSDAGHRGIPPAARAARPAPPGHARAVRRRRAILALLAPGRWCRTGAAPAPRRLSPTVAFERSPSRYPGGRRAAHDGLSFAVAAGERVGIVGPSGAGKSSRGAPAAAPLRPAGRRGAPRRARPARLSRPTSCAARSRS